MTPSEVKVFIAESNHSDFFKTNAATFDFSYIGFKNTYTGLSSIYEFVNKQNSGWDKIDIKLPSLLQESKSFFQSLKGKIDNYISIQDTNQLRNEWNQIISYILNARSRYPFIYNSPNVEFLLKVHAEYHQSFNSAFYFLVKHTNPNNSFNDINSITGVILAYEFSLKDNSRILERRNAEKSSLGKLRNDFEKYITESETELSIHLSNTKNKFDEYAQAIDSLKLEKEKAYNSWHEKADTAAVALYSDSKAKMEELKTTYERLLSLSKPAEYWNRRASRLKNQGWISLGIMTVLIMLSCASMYYLLWQTPEGMLKTFFGNEKSAALRWSIVFVTFISFLAFGIRALNKITFSSFHLARDAEERESLTYVYLALLHESSVEKEDRQLILQSLFSRADTGLLKEDSSPTMPGISSVLGSK